MVSIIWICLAIFAANHPASFSTEIPRESRYLFLCLEYSWILSQSKTESIQTKRFIAHFNVFFSLHDNKQPKTATSLPRELSAGFEPEREVATFSRFSDNLSLKI